MDYTLKHYAHLGDALYELFIREIVVFHAQKEEKLHKLTTKFVNAKFQAQMLSEIEPYLTDSEKEIARRARNLPISISKRNNPQIHHFATAFEVLIGFWHINDKARLNSIYEIIKKYLTFDEN